MLKIGQLKELFYYGLPAFAIALLGLPLYIYMPTFYAQNAGLGMFEVGAVLFVARFLDVLFDPFIGFVSDRHFSRESLMFLGAIVLICAFYFLTHPPLGVGYFWLFFFSVMVYFGWSMLSIPYYAFGADLGENYHQNTHYSLARELLNMSGVLLALLLPYVLDVANDAKRSLLVMFTTIAIILPLAMAFFLLKVKHKQKKTSLLSFFQMYKALLEQIKNSKNLFISFFLNNFANALPATLFLFYVNLVIKSPEFTGLLLLLYFVSGIVALPFWAYISKKVGKKRAWMFSMLSAAFFFAFVPFLGEGDLLAFTLITLLSGLSLGADMALPASMQADIAQNSSKNESELGGALFGFFAILTKLSLAFGVGVSFGVLSLFDFAPNTASQESLFVLSLLYGLLPLLLKVTAIISLWKYEEKALQI